MWASSQAEMPMCQGQWRWLAACYVNEYFLFLQVFSKFGTVPLDPKIANMMVFKGQMELDEVRKKFYERMNFLKRMKLSSVYLCLSLSALEHAACCLRVRHVSDEIGTTKKIFSFLLFFCFVPSWAFCVLCKGRKTLGQERGLNREHFAWNHEHFTSVQEFSTRRFARFPDPLTDLDSTIFFIFYFYFF